MTHLQDLTDRGEDSTSATLFIFSTPPAAGCHMREDTKVFTSIKQTHTQPASSPHEKHAADMGCVGMGKSPIPALCRTLKNVWIASCAQHKQNTLHDVVWPGAADLKKAEHVFLSEVRSRG